MTESAERRPAHLRANDLRGASRLAVDATIGLTRLVENLHHNIALAPGPLGAVSALPTRGITGLVYRSIRGVTRLVGGSLDALLGQAAALLGPGQGVSSPRREALVAALNGVLGDHLQASGNPLALPMQLSAGDGLADSGGRVLLMLHGLCMNPLQWRRDGLDYGATLAAEGGYTLRHLHYNTGLHIATNGRLLADQLQALHSSAPLRELVMIGHSMGGLVARSACHQARSRGDTWPQCLTRMVFLGSPHHGAPLERAGHGVDLILGASPYTAAFARLGKLRSAGITDLRQGRLLDAEDVKVPLPEGVACHAIAGLLGRGPGHAAGKLLGDGLVPLDSALGRHRRAARRLAFEPGRVWVGQGLNHLDLLGSEAVLQQLRRWVVGP